MNERVFRLVSSILVGLMVVAVVYGLGIIIRLPSALNETEIEIACTSAKANITQLAALDEIADSLGVPHTFMPPELPEECL